jgi:hypothetical protein
MSAEQSIAGKIEYYRGSEDTAQTEAALSS